VAVASAVQPRAVQANSRIQQAYQALHLIFTVAPILAGVDKFTNFLVGWDQYVAPAVASMLPFSPGTFMWIVGLVEISAGVGVFVMPRIFAYVVMAWLWGIIANLLLSGQHLDVAMRDLGLSVGAFSLGRLSEEVGDR
jgi:uncharacterized membrane protein